MIVRNCKEITYVAVLSILFVAAQCETVALTNFTESSDPGNSHGLDRIKLLSSMKKQSSPAVQPSEHKEVDGKMEGEQKKALQAENESESLTNIPDDDNAKARDASQKKVSSTSSSHEDELRSNSSSSAESVPAAGHLPSTHPLFADRHQGNAPGARPAVLVNRNTNSNRHGEIAHEHVIRYQLHQSSEQDSDEDASFKAPSASRPTPERATYSEVVNSDSLPVRLGPNTRVRGNSNANSNGILTIRKPIPVVRQETIQQHHTDSSENSDNSHHDERFML